MNKTMNITGIGMSKTKPGSPNPAKSSAANISNAAWQQKCREMCGDAGSHKC